MAELTIGSLCSGYGGLTLAVQAVLGGRVAWHSEYEPPTEKNPRPSQAAAKLLRLRWPGVPNLGDMTKIDWSTVEPVDIYEGGTPCQDVSHAGTRRGMRAGTRSGLWSSFVTGIEVLRPRLVIWENVRGVLYAPADSDLEPCPVCVGDGTGDALRALGRVLGDLADIGYDARWCGLQASDVGAPHNRFRVFVVAYPIGCRWDAGWPALGGDGAQADASGGDSVAEDPATSPDADRDAVREQPVAGLGGPAIPRQGGHLVPDPSSLGWREGRTEPAGQFGRPDAPVCDSAPVPLVDWGRYEPAVRQWERVLGRRAPAPSALNRKGTPKLSPEFDEWLMGVPAGWISEVPGISWNDKLKLCGNGVVPQQAAAAIRYLLGMEPLTLIDR